MPDHVAGAIDIGGTNLRVALVTASGNVLSERRMPVETGEGAAARCLEYMAASLEAQCAEKSIALASLSGIGVVCAGPIDATEGVIDNPYTLPDWKGIPIARWLEGRTRLPVKLEHDVNGALLGEVFLSGWQGRRVLMICIGTGIGVAMYERDHPYRAGARYHPEMGHVVVDAGAETDCYCRHKGCFESVWSGPALQKQAEGMGCVNIGEAIERFQKGDLAIAQAVERLRGLFAAGVWNLMVIFKPEVLVLGGGVMHSLFTFCKEILVRDHGGLDDFLETCDILPAKQKDGSAVIGASRLIFDK